MNGSHPTEQQVELREARGEYRPKLLFLAYYFPPLNSSGCVRTWNIAKYLARSGWDVTVVTPDPSLWRKVNDQNQVDADLLREGIRRLPTGHRWRCLSPWDLKSWNGQLGRLVGGTCRRIARRLGVEMVIGWEREVERACASLSRHDVDVILASGPPFISFRLARSLSKRLGRPYVLDYRDPWVTGAESTRLRTRSIMEEERRIVQDSSAVTVISPSLLKGRHGSGEETHVVTNGFDPEELKDIAPHDFGHFSIVYAGNFYPPKRVITPVMEVLRQFLAQSYVPAIHWMFHYYGVHGSHVQQEAEKFGVMERVVLHGKVSRKEALSAVRGAGISVVIASVLEDQANNDGGIVTGKLFEALGMGTPVLFVGPSQSDADVIAKTTGLVGKYVANDIAGMTAFLHDIMSGNIPRAKTSGLYAWPTLIHDMDLVLRRTIQGDPRLTHMSKPSDPSCRGIAKFNGLEVR